MYYIYSNVHVATFHATCVAIVAQHVTVYGAKVCATCLAIPAMVLQDKMHNKLLQSV